MRISTFFLPSLTATLPLFAQLDQGQIAGTIQDSSQASVGKATVSAVSGQVRAR